jgi:DNA-binding MarR family transcriptional regulator
MNVRQENTSRGGNTAAPFAYEGLERVIHEKARLGILASLATHAAGLAFSDLKQMCALTDGNLNRHLQVLQEAALVEIRKDTVNQRSQTFCQITEFGRERFAEYITVLERVVNDALHARQSHGAPAKPVPEGWSPA